MSDAAGRRAARLEGAGHRHRLLIRAGHQQVLGQRFQVRGDFRAAVGIELEREEIDQHRDRQDPDVRLAEALQPVGQLRRQIDGRHPLRPAAGAVELGPVLIGQKRLVVVRDEQRFGRGPEHLELSRSPEIGFAQEAARERQDTLLAILVRGNRVEDRGEAVRGLTIERERGRQQLRDLHIVERPGDAADDRHTGGVVVLALQHLHDDVRIELRGRGGQVAHDLGHAVGRHHRDDVREVAECRQDDGRLRGEHGRAVRRAHRRHHRRREIGDVAGTAGDGEQTLLGALVEDRFLAAGNRQHDRAPEVVAFGRFGDLAFVSREDLVVVDLLERDRRVTCGLPDAFRSATAAPFRTVQRQHAQERVNGLLRNVAHEGDRQDVAVVEERGGFGDAGLAGVRQRAFDHQRVRRDAERERGAERRFANRGGQSFDRNGDRRMLGRIQRPVPYGHQQSAGQLQQAPRELGGQLGYLGHASDYAGRSAWRGCEKSP